MQKSLRIFRKVCFALVAIFVIACVPFVLSACTGSGIGVPSADSDISGNGGSVVRMGEYTYFSDGYVAASTVQSKKESYATLYRLKDGEEKPEKIASRVVGFEGANLFIYGDSLFYVTPCMITDTTNTLRNDQIAVVRCGLDGSGAKEIYNSKSFALTTGTVGFVVLNNNPYVLIYEGTKIVRVDKNGKDFTLAEETTSVAFATVGEIAKNTHTATDLEKYVYFTKERNQAQLGEAGLTGNVLYKRDILAESSDSDEVIYMFPGITVTLKSVSSNALIYTRTLQSGVTSLFKSYGATNLTDERELVYLTTAPTNNLIVTGNRGQGKTEIGYVFFSDSKICFRALQSNGEYLGGFVILDSATTLLFADNAYVYYVKDSKFYRINVDSTAKTPELIDLTGYTVAVDSVKKADVDGEYFYFQAPIKYHEDDLTEEANRDAKSHTYRVALSSIVSSLTPGGKIEAELMWEYVPDLADEE